MVGGLQVINQTSPTSNALSLCPKLSHHSLIGPRCEAPSVGGQSKGPSGDRIKSNRMC